MSWLDRFLPAFSGLRRHIDAWRIAWAESKRQEPLRSPRGKELEFLPAVLEIQESPPSPSGRLLGFLIIALFSFAILWSIFGHIDIVATAQGKIVPNGYSKIIQPLETGVIKAIHVRNGSRVKQGDPLIEIDTSASPDRDRFSNEYLAALTEVARLRALMEGKNTFDPPRGADPSFVKIQLNRLREQILELHSLQSQAEAYKKLLAQQYVSQMQYLEVERLRAQKMQEHAAELSQAETQAHSLSKEFSKASTRASQQYLMAPIDGVVQQLAVHTVGGVVTPAQELMVIAPQQGGLEIEAWIENKDMGFVSENQEVEIKVESFPFTRYGTIDGRVLTLSGDAVPLEKTGLFYSARVSMASTTIRIENNKDITLTPGMAVTVEIKTGQRRLIEYFLSPLLRGVREAARER